MRETEFAQEPLLYYLLKIIIHLFMEKWKCHSVLSELEVLEISCPFEKKEKKI